jgi:hypothetical protein
LAEIWRERGEEPDPRLTPTLSYFRLVLPHLDEIAEGEI